MSTVLAHSSVDLALWERFHSGRCSDEEIASQVVLQRWLRCRNSGLSPDNPGEPQMALAELPESTESLAPLLAPGAPFDAFATTMANAGCCGLFCDANGVIIARRIAEPFQSSVAELSLAEGSIWSEAARGTNGMGTTLAERAPVAVIGAEHYELRNHALACYAAPVRDVRERVVAVLDASGPVSCASPFVHASVMATAAALEALIVGRTYDAAIPGGLFELERLLARLPHASFLVEATGHMRRANARFRAMLTGSADRELARLVGSHLASAPERAIVPRESTPPWLRGVEIELEPIGAPEDPFAAVVHLRSRHTLSRRRAPEGPVPESFSAIVGSDAALSAARSQAARFAPTDLPMLLMAETGAGKEIFARAIHAASSRRTGPFVAVNCGALAGTLLESELFGYAPGAFTGAAPTGRLGKLAVAHRGTLFLDEVGEMSLPAQATLLRFLEDGTYYRVGEATERRADVRLLAATSRELPSLVNQGRFRSDLFFRLRGVVLRLPALRERSDRRELALALLERIARLRGLPKRLGFSRAALEWIERHDWPGNVRELRSALEYAVVLAGDAPRIEVWHLPVADDPPESGAVHDLRAQSERTALVHALEQAHGNLSAAAKTLGVARSTLYRMMARHRLRPETVASGD